MKRPPYEGVFAVGRVQTDGELSWSANVLVSSRHFLLANMPDQNEGGEHWFCPPSDNLKAPEV